MYSSPGHCTLSFIHNSIKEGSEQWKIKKKNAWFSKCLKFWFSYSLDMWPLAESERNDNFLCNLSRLLS